VRLQRYEGVILPQAQQRLEAALAAYGAGSGTLTSVLDARRGLLDIRRQRLELQADAARHQVQLAYFAVAGEQP
jgi:outer membrane protein TolC